MNKQISFGIVFTVLFLSYVGHLIYSISTLFTLPKCENKKQDCLRPYLNTNPTLNLILFTSTTKRPTNWKSTFVYSKRKFDVYQPQDIPLLLDIPNKVRQNGSMFMHVFLTTDYDEVYNNLQYSGDKKVSTVFRLTDFMVPRAEAFNLLGQEKPAEKKTKKKNVKAVTHIKSKVTFNVMTEDIDIYTKDIPGELINHIKLATGYMYMPILHYDFLQTRQSHLVPIGKNDAQMNITVAYTPTSVGKLRLSLQFKAVLLRMKSLGFTDKDIDEIKSIFADTNLYLLGGTIFIAALHLCFDFLAFKNDIYFWRKRNNLAGLSVQTVVWRAFSQIVIFLYLIDEGSSLLVVVPTGIGVLIEMWKTKKILKAEIVRDQGFFPRIRFNLNQCSSDEVKTREFDAESMRYLRYVLYPLVFIGAVYSLLYQPHKSWYSWCINSMVNGVYAFGFLFMLPQLFVNYKLKSVAHLPWKAFMYKAFNTFIDDVFAFIITMPTAHRVACFRDDAVFLVYLYQRWLYPVDKNRIDSLSMDENPVEISKEKKKFK